ncbi:MAG: hypothetical protein WAQ27_00520 [Candidatus Microsaccharimonas sp.]
MGDNTEELLEEQKAGKITQAYRGFINDRPELLSLLYDIDLLPEQIRLVVNAVRMAGICLVWASGERDEIPLPKEGARGIES